MLARTLFNQIFLFKPSQIPLSVLSPSYRSITTAARVNIIFLFQHKIFVGTVQLKKQLNTAATPRPHIERPAGSDELYKRLCVEVRGHDPAVLESYEKFVRLVSTELDIKLVHV